LISSFAMILYESFLGTSLNEVTQELQERVHRWKQIELLCGFNIINNSGLQYLESVLYRGTANGRGGTLRGRMSSSTDDLDDENGSLYSPSAATISGLEMIAQMIEWNTKIERSNMEYEIHMLNLKQDKEIGSEIYTSPLIQNMREDVFLGESRILYAKTSSYFSIK
ncbi:hypothetical protein L9F63_010455, partial [Diploptera punctata]